MDSNNNTQRLTVQADTSTNARAMLEAQYGLRCIIAGPTRLAAAINAISSHWLPRLAVAQGQPWVGGESCRYSL